MNTQDKLIDVKDLSLVTSAVMTNIYDIQNDSEAIRNDISDLNYDVVNLYRQIENLPSPMVFKGSLGTGGTITSLPTASTDNEGYTYKVITAGTYASQAAKIGDMFISDGSTWVYVPSADEPSGTVTSVTLKATSPIAIDSSSAITTSGTRTISHGNSGVTAGTYRSVTVNATGHVTAGTNPTTLSGYGITDAKIADGVITLGSNTITPLTSSSTLDATKVSGTLPTSTYTNTKNTAGSTNSSNKLFLIGATSQAANPQTYSHDTAYVGTDGKLYSNSKEVVNLSDTQALTNKTYNGYTLAAASAKAVDTSITAASTSANLPTSAAVASFVEGKGYLTSYTETDPIYSASAAATISSSDITNWNNKIDASDYAGSANNSGGTVVLKTAYNVDTNASGALYCFNRTYAQYLNNDNSAFISKGTLENVITGKGLIDITALSPLQSGIQTNSTNIGDLSSLDTTTKTDLVSAINEVNSNMQYGVILYENDSGSIESSIPLNDSAANYQYIEIYYRTNDSDYSSVKVYQPNGKRVAINSGRVNSAASTPTFYGKTKTVYINNNTMTVVDNAIAQYTVRNATTGNVTAGDMIYITRVIGYTNTVTPNETEIEDTGWINLTLLSGASAGANGAVPAIRRIGTHVFVRGSIAFTASSSSSVGLAEIPEGFRPAGQAYKIGATGGATYARFYYTVGGSIGCDWVYNTGGSRYSGSVTWSNIDMDWFTD